ncbi:TPA: hypothetical protein ACJFPR_001139 [Streptococcus pyogenes]
MTTSTTQSIFSNTLSNTRVNLDIRYASSLSTSAIIAVNVAPPEAYHSLVGFEDYVDSSGKAKKRPVFTEDVTGYQLRAVMPSDETVTKDKYIKLILPTQEIAQKAKFGKLYRLVNPRGKRDYKSFDIYEIYADDIAEIPMHRG